MPLTNWLPDLKGALNGFYDERLKDTLESKSAEFKSLLQANMKRGVKTQKAIIAIALAIFLLLAIVYFWPDKTHGIQWKYLPLGLLVGYILPYVLTLNAEKSANQTPNL